MTWMCGGGEATPQLEVCRIVMHTSLPVLLMGRRIAVNRRYLCYVWGRGNIRIINVDSFCGSNCFAGDLYRHTQVQYGPASFDLSFTLCPQYIMLLSFSLLFLLFPPLPLFNLILFSFFLLGFLGHLLLIQFFVELDHVTAESSCYYRSCDRNLICW